MNRSTDSPWPISNNPLAKYNDESRKDCNSRIKLFQLVRASTAAPVYFPPETLQWDPDDPEKTFVFVDGGVTPYNNPAFLMYRMATQPAYNLNWEVGEDKLLIVSVGTGAAPTAGEYKNLIDTAKGLPNNLMYAMQVDPLLLLESPPTVLMMRPVFKDNFMCIQQTIIKRSKSGLLHSLNNFRLLGGLPITVRGSTIWN